MSKFGAPVGQHTSRPRPASEPARGSCGASARGFHRARLARRWQIKRVVPIHAVPSLSVLPAEEPEDDPNVWIGGVVPVRFRQQSEPVEVAAWITWSGIVVAAAEVEGDGAAVLRGLLVQALAQTAPAYVPDELVVCPSAEAAVQGVRHPPVRLERDAFLHTVVRDQIGIHETPAHLQRWGG